MGLSLRPQQLKRYRDLARLFYKYGRGDLLPHSWVDDDEFETSDLDGDGKPSASRAAELANDLEALGPTFVKVGQFLSTRADVLPASYIEALGRLQDHVAPFAFTEVERIVAEELGARISKVFSSFDDMPVAAASLGQVHRAQLRDGRVVAVKVQRPDIHECIQEDLDALIGLAEVLDRHTAMGKRQNFRAMAEEFRTSLLRELDYRQEARNLATLADNMASLELIVVPRPIDDYVTARVLTMEFVNGRKVTALGPLSKLEIDSAPLAEALCRAYLRQILVDGFFHADPHPGNVLLTDDGQVALLDLGMVSQVAPGMRESLLKLVLAVSEGRGEDAGDIVVRIGTPQADADPAAVRRRIGDMVLQFQGLRLGDIALGRFLFDAARAASEGGYRMPRELTMLSKTLLNVDEVARELDSDFDPNAAIRRNASELMRERMAHGFSPGKLFSGVLEAKEFVEQLPRRLNQFVDAVSENRLRVKVDTINEVLLMEGLQKIANRITLGLVIAAMIIGAALLMRVETPFRILGYPGLAMLCFLCAAVCGMGLIFNIVFHDLQSQKEKLRDGLRRVSDSPP